MCWPFIPDCGRWYFLESLPDGYSQSTFYMALYAAMLGAVLAMWQKRWTVAHAILFVLFLWKTYVVLLHYTIAGPYDYYHLGLTAALLFIPLKLYFLKLLFVTFYFLAGSTKFDETWILGTYFTTLQTGLPLFPDALTPLFTNFVILMQVIGAWFLLTKEGWQQRATLAIFFFFHLYSGIFVLYHYPSIALPPLIILFGMFYSYERPPVSRRAIAGWALIALVAATHIPPLMIEGDRRMTLEGNRFGMFMFEANHQCISASRVYEKTDDPVEASEWRPLSCNGQKCLTHRAIYEEEGYRVTEDRIETGAAWNRCDPYVEWVLLNARCDRNPRIERIALAFDHSINGGPFYRIVDTEDICALDYTPFRHNEWIRHAEDAEMIGIPVKDEYRY